MTAVFAPAIIRTVGRPTLQATARCNNIALASMRGFSRKFESQYFGRNFLSQKSYPVIMGVWFGEA